MSLIIDKNLLSVNKLIEHGIQIEDASHSYNSDVIRILIVNLMPKKCETEFQFLSIFGNMNTSIKVDFLYMETHTPLNTDRTYLERNYKTLNQVANSNYDGAIITGAPLEFLNFNDIEYWKELQRVIDFLNKKVKSTLYICWATMAGLYHNFGINKCVTTEKIFGVFPHVIVKKKEPLLKEINDGFIVPHSRYGRVRKQDIEKIKELEVLCESEESGIYIVSTRDKKQIYITGHPEYERCTLKKEYERDIKSGFNISVPKNYFPSDDSSQEINLDWSSNSQRLFSNWVREYLVKS
ncbi:homoserine O-acetyltransferase/O-succinyltransferase family protein [Clostridium sulfidigenes]|uniref:homoserine O-acetyltransferase/O-succinyltransferase family protein n=1 Tax=Clostridium sulfidigenes TaxID=318464 RepID=UPI003F8C38C7